MEFSVNLDDLSDEQRLALYLIHLIKFYDIIGNCGGLDLVYTHLLKDEADNVPMHTALDTTDDFILDHLDDARNTALKFFPMQVNFTAIESEEKVVVAGNILDLQESDVIEGAIRAIHSKFSQEKEEDETKISFRGEDKDDE